MRRPTTAKAVRGKSWSLYYTYCVLLKVVASCAIVGVLSATLVAYGNPGNMGICGVCFTRDIAGGLGLHKAVSYFRPEIIGICLGAFLSALAAGEFIPRAGSSALLRVLLGFIMATGALVFLGCPFRMLIRIGGGDLNALIGLAGFASGVAASLAAYNRGFTLGRNERTSAPHGLLFPAFMFILLISLTYTALMRTDPNVTLASAGGKGAGAHAPLWMSLAAGLATGVLFQKSRFCTVRSVHDIPLVRDFTLSIGVLVLIAAVSAGNIIAGNYRLGFDNQPFAHSNHLWSFLSMLTVGFASSLAGGCPVRQVVLAGEGNGGAGLTFLGMLLGTAIAHNLGAIGPSATGQMMVLAGLACCVIISSAFREKQQA